MLSAILRWLKRLALAMLAAIVIAAIVIAVTPQGRTGVKTALFLPQILPEFPVKPQEWFTGTPTRQNVSYPIASGSGNADVYVPASDGLHSAVLLFLGVNPAGRDDPRVVGLAEGLARSGVVVMIPWSDTMTQQRISVGDVDNLVYAFQYMIGLDVVDAEKAGMGGFCVGASFATVAAQDFRIRDQVKFVNFFGGYYNARDLVASVVTSTRFDAGNTEPWRPDSLSTQVIRRHLIEGVRDRNEQSMLSQEFIDRTASLNVPMIEALSTDAKVVYDLLNEKDVVQARKLVEALPASALATLNAISPITNIEYLNARVLIMHDREDALVPSEESRRLADSLAAQGNVYHTEFSLFRHLDPTRAVSPPIYVKELWKLYLHMYNVLRELS